LGVRIPAQKQDNSRNHRGATGKMQHRFRLLDPSTDSHERGRSHSA
jgi:hypothetical protein